MTKRRAAYYEDVDDLRKSVDGWMREAALAHAELRAAKHAIAEARRQMRLGMSCCDDAGWGWLKSAHASLDYRNLKPRRPRAATR